MKKILLLATFLSITSIGHAQVLAPGQVLLLHDNFDRGTPTIDNPLIGTATLNGSSPGYEVAPEAWTADSSITTNGSSAFVPGSSSNAPDYGVSGFIGIPGVTGGDLTVGKTYTLQFSMSQAHGGNGPGWTAVGFGTAASPVPTTDDWPGAGGNYAGFFAFDNGGGVALYQNGTIYYDPTVTGNSGSVILTIQVGAGLGGADLLSATINGITVLSGYNASLAPISQVFVGDVFDAQGGFSNLSVTENVPEPSTWAMLFGGVSVLFVVQRLRRKLIV